MTCTWWPITRSPASRICSRARQALGLAGGLLAELMLAGSIRLWRGMVVPADGPVPGTG